MLSRENMADQPAKVRWSDPALSDRGAALKVAASLGGVLAAIGASSYCVVPFALFTVGVGGALDDRWNGDISNPHGGPQKAFLPGLSLGSGNKEFEEEWKPVDEFGRLKLERSQRTAVE